MAQISGGVWQGMILIHHDIDLAWELFLKKVGYPQMTIGWILDTLKKKDNIMNFSGVYQPNGAAKKSSQRVYTPSVWVSSR